MLLKAKTTTLTKVSNKSQKITLVPGPIQLDLLNILL